MMATRLRRARKGERGQAMLEYSVLNWVLVVGLCMGATVRMIPSPDGGGGQPLNVIELFLWAYKTYFESFYFVLNMPIP